MWTVLQVYVWLKLVLAQTILEQHRWEMLRCCNLNTGV